MAVSLVVGRHELGHIAFRIIQIAVEASLTAAGLHAGRQLTLIGQGLAQRALAHHALGLVEGAHPVGARRQARLAADAVLLVDQHNARLLVAIRCARGAHLHAGGANTLLAHGGQPVLLDVRKRAIRPHRRHPAPVLPQGHVVLLLARDLAPEASDAAVEIDNNGVTRHRRHNLLPFRQLPPAATPQIARARSTRPQARCRHASPSQ